MLLQSDSEEYWKTIGLNEEQIEALIEKIEVHCFKRNLKFNEFIRLIGNISDISNNLEVAIDSLPKDVSQKKEELCQIVDKVVNLQMEKEDLLEDNKVTMEILLDYKKNRPAAEKIAATQRELENATIEMDSMQDEITKGVGNTQIKI